jgi:transcription antitermination factor NusG
VVRDKEIRTLKELIEGKAVKNFNVDAYQLGDKFEIKSGAFSGQTGVIKDVKNRNVTILLQQLGIAVTLSF